MRNVNTGRNLACLILILVLAGCRPEKQKPNFVFILVDDLGWTDLGYSGSSFYETPNIDELSQNSIRFNMAYAAHPVCSPTRAAIMTGQHPSRIKITDWIPGRDPKDRPLLGPQDLNELPVGIPTLADILGQNGYSTFFAGKWHLGGEGYLPDDQGFNINIGGYHFGQPPGGYYSPYKNPKLPDGPDGEYLTDRLTNESLSFLDQSGKDPFFMFLSYYTVHTPIQASKKHISKFKNKLDKISVADEDYKIDKSGRTRTNQLNADYASMLYALDENIGRLIKKLKEENLYDQTTIIFTSDNGGLSTLDTSYMRTAPTSVLPLRGGKGWLYEGGIRIPLLIKPGKYESVNRESEFPVLSHDFYPTILSMADIQIPDNHEVDGINISGLLCEDFKDPSQRTLIWDYPHYHGSGWRPGFAIREGNWKMIGFYETDEVELYNMKDDISEQDDLSKQYPGKTDSLKHKFQLWRDSLDVLRPSINPEYN